MNPTYIRPITFELMKTGGDVGGRFLGPIHGVTPLVDFDAATKAYVDSLVENLGAPIDGVHQFWKKRTGDGWRGLLATNALAGAYAMTRGQTVIVPVFVGDKETGVTSLSVRVQTAGAGSSIRLGFYELDHTDDLKPSQLILDAGTVSSTSTGEKFNPFTEVILEDIIFIGIALQAEGSATPPTINGQSTKGDFSPLFGYPAADMTSTSSAWYLAADTTVSDGAFQTDLDDFSVVSGFPVPAAWISGEPTTA